MNEQNKKCVVVYAHDPQHPGRVLLVKKDRPAWQKGCLNLLGGKIEEGETELETALRELKEESGLKLYKKQHKDVKLMGAIVSNVNTVYCVSLPVDSSLALKPRKGETEKVKWYDWDDARKDPRLIPNLLCIIPLIQSGVTGWFLDGHTVGEGVYEVTMRFLLDHPVPHKPEE